MKGFKILITVSIILHLCLHPGIFTQSTDQLSKHRGVPILVKDDKTGEEGIVNIYQKVYGVIIGIDIYENLSPDRHLRYAVRDAKGMKKILEERFVFDEIITMYNNEATREATMALLSGKLSQTTTEDAIFVFFAGHGYTDTTKYGELGYLIPYDGSFDENELYKNISMTQLKEDVSKRIPAKHVFFIVDACYSGLLVTRGKSHEVSRDLSYIRRITEEPVRQVLTAGGKGEEVLDGGPLGHSVFVGRIIQILKNTSDYITANELYIQIREKVYSDARAMGHTQTPDFGALFGLGDFVFIPRVDKRYEEIRTEISELEGRLKEIGQQYQKFKKIGKQKEMREAQRKAEEVKMQLKAKQLEEERLLKEKERKKRLEEEEKRLAQERAEMERQKAASERQLKELRQKLVEKEAKLKDIKQEVLSIDAARKEVEMLETKIKSIVSLISQEQEKALKQLKEDYDLLIKKLKNKPIPPKGKFETTEDYKARVKKHQGKIRSLEFRYISDYWKIRNRDDNEIAVKTKLYKDQINELKSQKYPVKGLNLVLLSYNADKESYSVKMTNDRGNIWYYLLSIKPDIARGLFDRKELLKAEGYYAGLENHDSLGRGFIIDPISGKHKLVPGIKLRSDYITISYKEFTSYLKQKGFFDSKKNQSGEFNNQFELIKIKKHKVVLDYATGLMWHQSGSSDFFPFACGSFKKANSWIEKLNKKYYSGYNDYNDWRLPTLEEAVSLLESVKRNGDLYIDPLFSSRQLLIWTGDKENPNGVWTVDFKNGDSGWLNLKKRQGICPFVRPVRSMQ